ncbi:isomerase [Kitasatospora cineracea]|uniref:5-carboxymethyl-2-hydroxymuconate Delta-isomerase n=1 Tax=Kitasatospora cineracea TaxID=88074 RepID=UPI0004C84400
MPHITVDYSPQLADVFDRPGFVRELHPLVREWVASRGVCKTFFRPAAETWVDGSDGQVTAFVHIAIGLLPGRPEGLKARLSEEVLRLLDKHLRPVLGREVVRSAEVRDLAASYRLRTGW